MKNKQKFGKYLYIVYIVINALFAWQVVKLNSLPTKYLLGLLTGLILVALALYFGLVKTKRKFAFNFSKVLAVIISLALLFGTFYISKFGSFLGGVSGSEEKIDTVSIIVRKDSSYKTLDDIKDLVIGYEDDNETIVQSAIADFNSKAGKNLNLKEVASYEELARQLYDGELEAIILNEAYRNFIRDEYPEFDEDTRVISEFVEKTIIDRNNVNVSKDVFSVMISGIDVYGSISNNSRSDVNILAVVNPSTKKIVLISIPRDYYLPLACRGNAMDKLTHTGIYGVDCTMDTVGTLFGVDIDYYARVNFSSLINVVNAVGGVTVYNDQAFSAGSYSFPAGENYLDGTKALVFVRDRKHQSDGDSGRGRNQVKVLSAIINKMASPALITNFSSILGSLEGSFQTNLTTGEINSLVKMQLNDMSGWDIIQEQVSGTGTSAHSYALGGNYYMMVPDMSSVNRVKEIINANK